MKINNINTSCTGFTLFTTKDISKSQFINLCYELENEFNDYYSTDKYKFSPERISEGGIIYNNFNDNSHYKTMRFFLTDKYSCTKRSLYGFVTENIMDEWINDSSILIKSESYIGTYLKSFNQAPQWTKDELNIFKKCFENIGLIIHELPSRLKLKELSDPHYYTNLFY